MISAKELKDKMITEDIENEIQFLLKITEEKLIECIKENKTYLLVKPILLYQYSDFVIKEWAHRLRYLGYHILANNNRDHNFRNNEYRIEWC